MTKEKINELLTEAVELIKEFGELSKFVCDGESIIESIRICEDGESIAVTELGFEDEENIYKLNNISSIIVGPMGHIGLLDGCEEQIQDLESDFDDIDKEEFINTIGNLHYVELRTLKIVERLKEMQKEC